MSTFPVERDRRDVSILQWKERGVFGGSQEVLSKHLYIGLPLDFHRAKIASKRRMGCARRNSVKEPVD